MSTLPFLLSVADELDNINSQSYMDDFGLGFHPHRHYYRTPTIQLSLPASTDWMQNERSRYRTPKFSDDLPEDEETAEQSGEELDSHVERYGPCTSASVSKAGRAKSKLNEDNIDDSVQLYNLSKKCCKNYYRHATEQTVPAKEKHAAENSGGYRLQSRCLEGNNSSSDESLQKVSSSIEFLTCFLVKKTRASKNTAAAASAAAAAMAPTSSSSVSVSGMTAAEGASSSSSKKS